MNANPRFVTLMGLYAMHDRLTLMLGSAALVAVLFGFLLTCSGSGKLARIYKQVYFGFLLVSYLLILAGTYFVS